MQYGIVANDEQGEQYFNDLVVLVMLPIGIQLEHNEERHNKGEACYRKGQYLAKETIEEGKPNILPDDIFRLWSSSDCCTWNRQFDGVGETKCDRFV